MRFFQQFAQAVISLFGTESIVADGSITVGLAVSVQTQTFNCTHTGSDCQAADCCSQCRLQLKAVPPK